MRNSWLIAATVFAACGGGLERVAFVTDQLTYQPGKRVGLSLVNVSGNTVGVNLCLSRVVDSKGLPVTNVQLDERCDSEFQRLDPSVQFDGRKVLSPDASTGQWRFETTVRLASGGEERVYSNFFTVTPQ